MKNTAFRLSIEQVDIHAPRVFFSFKTMLISLLLTLEKKKARVKYVVQ